MRITASGCLNGLQVLPAWHCYIRHKRYEARFYVTNTKLF